MEVKEGEHTGNTRDEGAYETRGKRDERWGQTKGKTI